VTSRRRRRLLAASLLVAAAAILAAFALWVVSSERGARLAFEQLGAGLPGDLRIGRLRGSIRGPLEVRDLRYETDRVQIAIDRLALNWSLRRLADHRIDIHRLDADSVRVVYLTPRDSALARDSLGPELPDIDLPLDITVNQGRVRGIHITPLRSDSAVVIDEVTMTRLAFLDTIGIGTLAIRSSRGAIQLSGKARPRGRYALDLDGRWSYRLSGGRVISGAGPVAGNLDTLRFDQRVDAPFEARLVGAVYKPMRSPSFAVTADFARLDPRWISPAWPSGRTSGRIVLTGRPAAFTSRGTLEGTLAEWGRLDATYDLAREDDRYRIARLDLRLPGRPARLEARGWVTTSAGAARLDLAASWRDIALPLDGTPAIESPSGRLRLIGTTASYRFDGDAVLTAREIPPSPWRFAGTGDSGEARFESLVGRVLGGTVTGNGAFGWSAGRWRLALGARGLHPEALRGGWPGQVGFDLAARGASGPGGTRGEFTLERLSGALRGQPVSGRAAGRFAPGQYDFAALHLEWGPNRLDASGLAGRSWNFTWAIDAPDLTGIVPRGSGSLESRGTLVGAAGRPRVQGTLTADSLRWRDHWLTRLTANADVDLGGDAASRLDVEATQLGIGGRAIDHGTLRATGRRGAHEIRAALSAFEDSLTVAARGGLFDRGWNGSVTQLDLVSRRFGAWALEREARLGASARLVDLDDLCWRSGATRWCANFAWQRGNDWTLDSRLVQVPLAVFDTFFPAGLDLNGPMDGSLILRGRGPRWRGRARFDFGPGELLHASGGGGVGSTRFERSSLRLDSEASGVNVALAFRLGPAGDVEGELRLPPAGMPRAASAQAPVSGRLRAALRDLAFLQGFIPRLSATRGTLDADVRLAGTAGRPRWSGTARLSGSAQVPEHGVTLSAVTIDARGTEDGRLVFEGGARSGPGRIAIRGEASIDAEGTPIANGRLTGQQFEALNSRDGRILVNPDLTVRVHGDSLRLTGEIVIPEADLHPEPRRGNVVVRSADVVYVGGDSTQFIRRRPIAFSAEVRLVLGDEVRIRARGLDVRPTGSVLAVDEPNLPTTGTGELMVKGGTYRAYGQDLEIERGRLVFGGGPIDNPGIELRAVRRARDGVVAGFELRGTMKAPQLTLFSQPPMSDREALGYVLFGRSISRGNRSEEELVTDAANTLGVQGGSYVAGTLARKFGIDEATLETEGTFKEASLILGTYLSPRLYVNYGVGILDPVSTLRIQYFLNRKWTLLAETGDETSAGILYTVER
jgi:translocation and assembly module TamB